MRFVLLLVAAVIAVVVGIAAMQWSKGSATPAASGVARSAESQNVTTVDILVAKTPIAIGTVLDQNMVDKQPWPSHLVLDGFIVSDGKNGDIVGKVARASFQPHEPFMASKLANPNDPSFLAAGLPAGMRAITLSADAITGVAGYIFPGDRVDLLFAHSIPKEIRDAQQALATGSGGSHATNQKPVVSEVLVPNLRILAVNLRQSAEKQGLQGNVAPANVTVEISEADAERVRLAEKHGTLSLAIRSLKDEKNKEVPPPVLLENLSAVRVQEQTAGNKIKIVRGVGKEGDASAAAGGTGFAGAMQAPQPTLDIGSGPTPEQTITPSTTGDLPPGALGNQ